MQEAVDGKEAAELAEAPPAADAPADAAERAGAADAPEGAGIKVYPVPGAYPVPEGGGAEAGPMRQIRLEKIVLNMGVGRSGDAIEAAKRALAHITGKKPCARGARETQRDFGVRKGEPIGAMVTVRGSDAAGLAGRLFEAKGNQVAGRAFDDFGNFSFGIGEHIDIPGVKYDPGIGILGLDVAVALARPGYGIRKRSKHKARVGRRHRITAAEARDYVSVRFGVAIA